MPTVVVKTWRALETLMNVLSGMSSLYLALAYFQKPTHPYPETGRGARGGAPGPAQVGHLPPYLGQELALFQAAQRLPSARFPAAIRLPCPALVLPAAPPNASSPRHPTPTPGVGVGVGIYLETSSGRQQFTFGASCVTSGRIAGATP